jgi:hypothetical protein
MRNSFLYHEFFAESCTGAVAALNLAKNGCGLLL